MRKWNPLFKRWEIPDPTNAALFIEAPHMPVETAPAVAPKINAHLIRVSASWYRAKGYKYGDSLMRGL